MNWKRIIPDSFTCGNLLCGAMAVLMATQNAFTWAFMFISIGAFLDFFDGMTARAMGIVNRIGVELDSLADDITFGLAPAMMLCCYLRPLVGWWCLIVLLMAAFSALRLAKFNTDERQTVSFIGLPTPPNAIFWAGICCMPYAMQAPKWMPWMMIAFSLVSCYLLISEIPFFSLKLHSMKWSESKTQYLFLIGCIILITFCVVEAIRFREIGFALFSGTACVVWFVLMNGLTRLMSKHNR